MITVQRVESVLLSIISLLDDAKRSSPANVAAGVMLRNDFARFKAKVTKQKTSKVAREGERELWQSTDNTL